MRYGGWLANCKLWWRVKYRGYPEPEWQPATSFLQDIHEKWLKNNTPHKVDLKLSNLTRRPAFPSFQ